MCAPTQKQRRNFLIGSATATLAGLSAWLIPSFLRKASANNITIRRSYERGVANHGWLYSRHTFSFADYYSPKHMGFGDLRVINEDKIQGGTGFNTHPHKDMEIISYVISGSLEHKDSMGNTTIIRPGEVQRMSAGTGVRHSEFNNEQSSETHFLQIWILPNKNGVTPGYGQKSFAEKLNKEKLVHVVSQHGENDTITMNQDANVYISRLQAGEDLEFKTAPLRKIWLQVVKGTVDINGEKLEAGDGLSAQNLTQLDIEALHDTELLLFDLA